MNISQCRKLPVDPSVASFSSQKLHKSILWCCWTKLVPRYSGSLGKNGLQTSYYKVANIFGGQAWGPCAIRPQFGTWTHQSPDTPLIPTPFIPPPLIPPARLNPEKLCWWRPGSDDSAVCAGYNVRAQCAGCYNGRLLGGDHTWSTDDHLITRARGQRPKFHHPLWASPASSCIIGQTIRHRGEHNHPLRRCITALWFCVFYLDSRTSRTDIFGVAPKHRSTICVEHILEEHNGHPSARLQGAKWARSVSIRLWSRHQPLPSASIQQLQHQHNHHYQRKQPPQHQHHPQLEIDHLCRVSDVWIFACKLFRVD